MFSGKVVSNQTQYKKSLILENYNKLLDKCFLKPITQPFHNAIQGIFYRSYTVDRISNSAA